jgi:hypothetical protein
MRYLTITYYRKPDGRIDESVSPRRSLRPNDYTMSSVILDFRDLKVIKASLEGHTIPPDFNHIVEYYHEHHGALIRQLFEANGYRIEFEKQS